MNLPVLQLTQTLYRNLPTDHLDLTLDSSPLSPPAITVDNVEELIGAIAHEFGHLMDPVEYGNSASTRLQTVAYGVESEGKAEYNNYVIENEIAGVSSYRISLEYRRQSNT